MVEAWSVEKTQARIQVRKGFREQVTDKRGEIISLGKKNKSWSLVELKPTA